MLVTEEDLEEALLPAGNRREPLAALGRADVVVLREEERERVEARVRGLMRAGAAVWSVRRELRFAEGGAGARPLAFCAIARPEEFWAMLEEAGCGLAGRSWHSAIIMRMRWWIWYGWSRWQRSAGRRDLLPRRRMR